MKSIIIIFSLVSLIFANDFLNIPLKDYISTVSKANNINIVLDENIDSKITFLISKDLDKNTYLEVLHNLLENKNLFLEKHKNFYIIKNKAILTDLVPEPLEYFSIKLNFVKFEEIENFLKMHSETIKYNFINSSKLLILQSKKTDFHIIKKFINTIDTLPSQLKLKITIVDTNIDKLKEYGLENQLNIKNDSDTNFFFNLVSYPFTVTNDVSNLQSNKFYSFIKMINKNGSSDLVSSPIITISDNKPLVFEVANTIPYSTGTTTINDDDSKTTTSIQYKDVGLKITSTPKIFNDDLVYLDLDLELSNVVSTVDNIPIISKKHIKQNFYMRKGKLFVLTGLNQKENINSINGVPFLMDIPYLGWLFKYESKSQNTNNLSIVFEIIDNKKVDKDLAIRNDLVITSNPSQTKKYNLASKEENKKRHQQILKEYFDL